jgi:hypothetical protein
MTVRGPRKLSPGMTLKSRPSVNNLNRGSQPKGRYLRAIALLQRRCVLFGKSGYEVIVMICKSRVRLHNRFTFLAKRPRYAGRAGQQRVSTLAGERSKGICGSLFSLKS